MYSDNNFEENRICLYVSVFLVCFVVIFVNINLLELVYFLENIVLFFLFNVIGNFVCN